jgi:hypothetical protein
MMMRMMMMMMMMMMHACMLRGVLMIIVRGAERLPVWRPHPARGGVPPVWWRVLIGVPPCGGVCA